MKEFLAKISRRNWIIIGAVLIVVLIVVVAAAQKGKANSNGAFQTTVVQRGNLVATVGATGNVRAIQSATLNWQTSGTVDQVNVKVGDFVHKGDVLATLAPTSLPQNVIMAQSDLVTAKKALDDLLHSDTDRANAWVNLRNAQDAYKKANDYRNSLTGKIWLTRIVFKTLGPRTIPVVHYFRGYADPQTLGDADADLALKKAQLDDAQRAFDRLKGGPNQDDLAAAQAKVDAAQATLNMARIVAPFDGTVTQAEPLPGDQASAGGGASAANLAASSSSSQSSSGGSSGGGSNAAFRVDDLSGLLVDVDVSEVDINSISEGQPVTLDFDAVLGKTYHGEVVEVAQAGDSSGGAVNFTVTVQITDADEMVKPGMTAAVTITVKDVKGQLLVPNRAVRLVDNQRVVYVLRNGQPQEVPITLGASSDTMSVVAGGNLKAGDLVILNPPTQFQGGPRIGGGGG